jgi:hypothetical protein
MRSKHQDTVTMALIKDVPVGQLFATLETMFKSAHSSLILHVDDLVVTGGENFGHDIITTSLGSKT